jgi:protein involved in polysaccharide export with SLBB domain
MQDAIRGTRLGDSTANAGPVRSSPASLLFGACLALATALGVGDARGGAGADESARVLKPNDSILWSAEQTQDWASAAWGCVGTVSADGMLNLGAYGSVKVAGLTLREAKAAIDRQIARSKAAPPRLPQGQLPSQKYNQPKAAIAKEPAPNAPKPCAGAQLPAKGPDAGRPPAATAGFSRPQLLTYGSTPTRIEASPSLRSSKEQSDSRIAKAGQGSCAIRVCGAQEVAPADQGPRLDPPAAPSVGTTAPAPDRSSAPSAQTQQGGPPAARPTNQPPENAFPAPSPKPPLRRPAEPTAAPRLAPPMVETLPVARPMGPIVSGLGPCQVPQECSKISLPTYIIEPPDVLLIESTQSLRDQPIRGQHLVRPDGTIGMGIYGSVYVAGMTLEQAQAAIVAQVSTRVQRLDARDLYVDVLAYNSKVYYVITDGGGYGEQVLRFPITGNETVLDAISQIAGLPAVASKKQIWLARPVPGDCHQHQILPVDWLAITQGAVTATNYQILPGDRVYVMADRWITFDSRVAKVLSPFTRMLGFTLLGAETVQTIRNRNGGGNGGF